ncbi:PVC-type heme-binding CxxCH protein [Verrucomicrobiaceae bacterium 227]
MNNPALGFALTSILILQSLAQTPDPKSLEFTKWTPNFQVPDPVAISFDEQGRAYVTQTQRRKANDLDIRNNRDWIPNDLSFQSPDDKRAFYRQNFTPENSDTNKKRVDDFNKDGRHDLKDLKALTERILLIEDTDGDGFADKSSTYAEGFTDEIAGIAAGVLHHDGDVYTTIVPDVWKLRDTNNDGKADTRESIVYGFGAHLAYAGHDMHGLTVGPDGRIYWTIGDKGVSVKSKEGHHFKYPNQGALLRCDPDGRNFEVYARGLRNVQEIAFDQYGNIFGVDNDSDRPGEKERFVYIVQHMDAGWRSNWQYRNGVFNPWMDENLSVPYQENQPAYITPPISLYENGPAGMAFNPGTALSEEWTNYFFHTSAPNGQQWAFQVEENGASYKMVNDMQIGNGVPIVGINFGPDGALYGVDWGGGYPLNEKGAVWKWDVATKNPRRESTAAELKADFSKYETWKLTKLLEHPDQRVRLKTQFELVNRIAGLELHEAALKSTRLGRIHAIWGLAQLQRTSVLTPDSIFFRLLEDKDPEIRTQAAKAIGDLGVSPLALHQTPAPDNAFSIFEQALIPLLNDPSDRVKFQAAIAIGNLGEADGANSLLKMARTIKDESHTYLRHAAIVGLTGCASPEFLKNLANDESELIQKIAIVALRRRADPSVAAFLNSKFEQVAAEAARSIHDDWTIPEAMPALAATLDDTQWIKNEPLIRRAINANFHLGTPQHAQRISAFAARSEVPELLRLEAIDALAKWSKPDQLDRVVGRFRPLEPRNSDIAKEATVKQIAALLTDPNAKIQSQAMSLARSLKVEISGDDLFAIATYPTTLGTLRIEALRSLADQKHPKLNSALSAAMTAEDVEVSIEALKLTATIDPKSARATCKDILEAVNARIPEKHAALSLLAGALASPEGDELLKSLVSSFDQIPAGIQLDLAEAAELRKLEAPAPDFTHTLEGGDANKGKDLFMNHLAAQCIRCHKVADGKGSNIGPNLKSVGLNRDRPYLLESLIDPQKAIAEGYGTLSLTLNDGKSMAGQFRSEKNGIIEIRDLEGKTLKIKSSDIKERSEVISTMPPMGLILQKREIRDVIEYLSTLRAGKK